MKLRFSPKYFYIRTGVISFSFGTLLFGGLSFLLTCQYITDQSDEKHDGFWVVCMMYLITLLFAFLTYIAWKSYDETLRKHDKAKWTDNKWTVIRRWLFEPYG